MALVERLEQTQMELINLSRSLAGNRQGAAGWLFGAPLIVTMTLTPDVTQQRPGALTAVWGLWGRAVGGRNSQVRLAHPRPLPPRGPCRRAQVGWDDAARTASISPVLLAACWAGPKASAWQLLLLSSSQASLRWACLSPILQMWALRVETTCRPR